jgi:hypothetical protein
MAFSKPGYSQTSAKRERPRRMRSTSRSSAGGVSRRSGERDRRRESLCQSSSSSLLLGEPPRLRLRLRLYDESRSLRRRSFSLWRSRSRCSLRLDLSSRARRRVSILSLLSPALVRARAGLREDEASSRSAMLALRFLLSFSWLTLSRRSMRFWRIRSFSSRRSARICSRSISRRLMICSFSSRDLNRPSTGYKGSSSLRGWGASESESDSSMGADIWEEGEAGGELGRRAMVVSGMLIVSGVTRVLREEKSVVSQRVRSMGVCNYVEKEVERFARSRRRRKGLN